MTLVIDAINDFIEEHPEMSRDDVDWFVTEKLDEALNNRFLEEEEKS